MIPDGAGAAASRRGIALPVVIAVLAILSILVLGFAAALRARTETAHHAFEHARAEALAEAGITLALAALTTTDGLKRWAADGTIHEAAFDGGSIRIAIQDEAGKIDLNWAPPELLRGLLAEFGADPGVAAEIVAAVLARRRAGFAGLAPAMLQPAGEVPGAALTGGPKPDEITRLPFSSLGQLASLPGMTPALDAKILPWLTIDAESGHVSRRTAPLPVLLAIPGMGPAAAHRLIAGRGAGATIGPGADALPAVATPYLATLDLRAATITAEAVTAEGVRFTRRAVVALTALPYQPFRILEWGAGG